MNHSRTSLGLSGPLWVFSGLFGLICTLQLPPSRQASSGYWEIVRDSLSDLVRIQMHRCYDEKNHKDLYDHVRGLRGQVGLCAFPNLFITIAPAEWIFHTRIFYGRILIASSRGHTSWHFTCTIWYSAFGGCQRLILGTAFYGSGIRCQDRVSRQRHPALAHCVLGVMSWPIGTLSRQHRQGMYQCFRAILTTRIPLRD